MTSFPFVLLSLCLCSMLQTEPRRSGKSLETSIVEDKFAKDNHSNDDEMASFVKLPSKDELEAINGIDSLMRSITSYVDQESEGKDYRTVIFIYGALCESLVQQKILDYADIPPLYFKYHDSVYVTHVSTIAVREGQIEDSARKRRKKGVERTLHDRAVDLLRDLQQWSTNLRQETRGMKRKAQELSLADVDDSSIEAVKQRLDDVVHYEEECSRLNGLANLTYYRLGHAYKAWAREAVTDCQHAITTRTFHSKVFPRFCLEYGNLTQSKEVPHSFGLRKKLERARKFMAIGEIIGSDRLARCKGLSVLKVDAMPMRVLDVLLNEFPEELQAIQQQS